MWWGHMHYRLEKFPRVRFMAIILIACVIVAQTANAQLLLQGGDDIGSATVIPELPFMATGTTDGYNDDYDFDCPTPAPGSPDVVYSYAPPSQVPISISLCESGFDTKVYVFTNEPPNVLVCSDDGCGTDTNRSVIFDVMLEPANTYYIVVDGHNGSQGNYSIEINIIPPDCNVQPPPNAVIEDEAWCYDGYSDSSNGGCHGDMWDTIQVNTVFFGTSGTFLFDGLQYRDTDWLEFELSDSAAIQLEGLAEFDMRMVIIRQGSISPCHDYELLQWGEAPFCSPLTIYTELRAGRYWAWVGTSAFEGVECGREYILELRSSGGPTCDYIPGDANNNTEFNGVDVTYSVNYLKGLGAPPPFECDCPPNGMLYSAADANGSCQFNGVDVSYSVNYLKGLGPIPFGCADCPPTALEPPVPAVIPIGSPTIKPTVGIDRRSAD